MKRGEVWRYEPVINRSGRPGARLIVPANAINDNPAVPIVYAMHLADTDPASLLAARIGEHGWAVATEIDRPVRKRLVERLGEATADEMDLVDSAIRATFEV